MSTVPPNSNDDRDATPGAPAPSADQAAVPGTPPPGAAPGDAGPADAPAAPPVPESGDPGPTGSDVPVEELAGAASPPAPGAPDEPAAEPPAAEPPADGAAEPAPPTQTFGTGEEPATRQLPTEEEDEALRAERARRFGRVASSGAEPADPGRPGPDGTAAGAGAAGAAVGAGAAAGDPAEPQPTTTTATDTTGAAPPPVEDDPFADFDEGPASRAAAHWWGILIAIVFGPVTWYLVADGGERISYSLSQNLEAVNVMGLVELGGGLITLIIMLMAARWSSVGSIIIGSIATLIGAAFLAVPQIVADFLASQSMIFDRLGQFGTNVHDHLVSDGHSGRLLLYGITFIFIGVISHGARRQGRREERRKAALGA
ncbi:ABC transporter permease [Ruania albidiflava]|uniref:ABC transporter permease n=1 Tax=Ruania albidiflava TaxID=366586 RepID=UPI0003B684E0|nr:ABC transporter permease [Ruania albidiflava]